MMESDVLRFAAERGIHYRETVDDRLVAPPAEAIAALKSLGGPLSDAPTDAEEVLRLLDEIGSPATVATTGAWGRC